MYLFEYIILYLCFSPFMKKCTYTHSLEYFMNNINNNHHNY